MFEIKCLRPIVWDHRFEIKCWRSKVWD